MRQSLDYSPIKSPMNCNLPDILKSHNFQVGIKSYPLSSPSRVVVVGRIRSGPAACLSMIPFIARGIILLWDGRHISLFIRQRLLSSGGAEASAGTRGAPAEGGGVINLSHPLRWRPAYTCMVD